VAAAAAECLAEGGACPARSWSARPAARAQSSAERHYEKRHRGRRKRPTPRDPTGADASVQRWSKCRCGLGSLTACASPTRSLDAANRGRRKPTGLVPPTPATWPPPPGHQTTAAPMPAPLPERVVSACSHCKHTNELTRTRTSVSIDVSACGKRRRASSSCAGRSAMYVPTEPSTVGTATPGRTRSSHAATYKDSSPTRLSTRAKRPANNGRTHGRACKTASTAQSAAAAAAAPSLQPSRAAATRPSSHATTVSGETTPTGPSSTKKRSCTTSPVRPSPGARKCKFLAASA
jgi:hypothetical protein